MLAIFSFKWQLWGTITSPFLGDILKLPTYLIVLIRNVLKICWLATLEFALFEVVRVEKRDVSIRHKKENSEVV